MEAKLLKEAQRTPKANVCESPPSIKLEYFAAKRKRMKTFDADSLAPIPFNLTESVN